MREKQQIGALAVAEAKRQRTIVQLVGAYRRLVDERLVAAGSTPRNGIWAAKAGVTVRTLQKHRAALQAALGTGDERKCEDKKRGLATPKKTLTFFIFLQFPDEPKSLPADNSGNIFVIRNVRIAHRPRRRLWLYSPSRRLLAVCAPVSHTRPDRRSYAPVPSWLAGLVLVPSPAPVVTGQAARSPPLQLKRPCRSKPRRC